MDAHAPLPGLGNRFMALVSAFAYAMLTNRALLMPHDAFVAELVCNPFQESSWLLPEASWQ